MVLESSALVAILQEEPERRRFLEVIAAAASVSMSTATFVEASTVLEARFGAEALVHLDRFLERAGVELIPVDLDQAREARDAFSRFGKRRHAVGLNYGDCFAYGLARSRDERLLYEGDDFTHTDVEPVT
jgi:ribonuclease VapC